MRPILLSGSPVSRYSISTVDMGDPDPMVVVHFRWLFHTTVNRLMRVVFSLLSLDMWQPLYGIGRSLTQTTYRLWVLSKSCLVYYFSFIIKNALKF